MEVEVREEEQEMKEDEVEVKQGDNVDIDEVEKKVRHLKRKRG